MSNLDFLNNQFQLEDFNSEEYFNALISPVPENKRQEMPLIVENSSETRNNPQIPYVDHPNAQNIIHPSSNNNSMLKNVIHPHNLMPQNNMLKHRIPSPNILQHPPSIPQVKILPPNPNANNNLLTKVQATKAPKIKIVQRKRKIAESTKNLQLPTTIVNNDPINNDLVPEYNEDETVSPTKKSKKGKGTKKSKKDNPKRKRVNYCFEIHRSGCALNKSAKLYCKVFLKGKLQSEVDLIKGARGKWAYTFYDSRKKKKERRYWPSQSSGPIIEDPCNCDKCVPSTINDEEVDFSSPSTEEATLVEYEHSQGNQVIIKNESYQIVPPQHHQRQQINVHQYENQQVVYYPNNGNITATYHPNEIVQEQYNHFVQMNEHQYPKNVVLKSSNDFQDNRSHYLKSSNDFMATHQRPWENYFQVANGEYNNDGFFVENNFL